MRFVAITSACSRQAAHGRQELSSFRGFFRCVARDGVIREDPTAEIAMPKIARSLARCPGRTLDLVTLPASHRG